MLRSIVTVAKVTLVLLNIWVLAVVLVVSLGHWRVFDSNDSPATNDNPHMVVMRELQEEGVSKLGIMSKDSANPKTGSKKVNPELAALLDAVYGGSPSPGINAPKQHPAEQKSTTRSPPVTTRAPISTTSDPRVSQLQYWCTQQHPKKMPYDKIPKAKLTSILVDERHKLLFCQIPSVAINDWRKILLILGGVVNKSRTNEISGGDVFGKYAKFPKRLSDYGDKERSEMLKKYFKVIFVRDPLERLVIAYRTKMASKSSKYFHRAFGSLIIKKYRKKATAAEIKAGTSVKFSEFVKFILDNEHSGTVALNEHWEQYYKQCHPCLVNYNFIGTFENVEKDTEAVLDKVKASKIIKPPYISDTAILSQKELGKVYSEIQPHELNNLFKVYSSDYTLFGYQCPNFVHEQLQKASISHDY